MSFNRRKLQLLEAVVAVLSPLFAEEREQIAPGGPADIRTSFSDQSQSEISIFLVCAELRVAMSMCQHFKELPKLLVPENK